MKTIIKFLVGGIFFATLFSLLTCSKKHDSEKLLKGNLKLSVGISVTEYTAVNKLKATTDDFAVEVFNSNNVSVASYAHASDIPSSIELTEGIYYTVVNSVGNPAAAFESPYYMGNSGAFTITAAQTSTVAVTCSLSNIMVTVVYSDRVKSSYATCSTSISVTGSTDSLIFDKSETRAGYYKSGPLHIRTNLYVAGTTLPVKVLVGDIVSPQGGKHYEVNVDASPTSGSALLNIALNETVDTEVVSITDANTDASAPVYGDLLITEIMYNPLALTDAVGEWIEVYNNSKKEINLKGLVLRRGSASTFHKISSDVVMAMGAYAVLGRTSTATNNVQYVYASINLGNSGDEIILNNYGTNGMDGGIICSVGYASSDFPVDLNGKSMQLKPSVKDATAAKLGTNWCASSVIYSTGDYGTPGLANSVCP
jgi:hypothetical protein